MTSEIGENHVDDLDGRLHALREACVAHGQHDDFDFIIGIIHKPGWTTLPELELVRALIDATEHASDHLDRLRKALRDGVVAVGDASQAGDVK
jgi:hypothetical protein